MTTSEIINSLPNSNFIHPIQPNKKNEIICAICLEILDDTNNIFCCEGFVGDLRNHEKTGSAIRIQEPHLFHKLCGELLIEKNPPSLEGNCPHKCGSNITLRKAVQEVSKKNNSKVSQTGKFLRAITTPSPSLSSLSSIAPSPYVMTPSPYPLPSFSPHFTETKET